MSTTDSTSTKPFFVVGAQRSGTTMLRLMLNSHPDLCVPFESHFLAFHPRLADYGDLSQRHNAARLLDDIAAETWTQKGGIVHNRDAILEHRIGGFADLIDAIFREHARAKGKSRWGVKTPGYVTELDTLWGLFPGCRIVHLVRDGRDVALSLKSLSWGTDSLPRAAADWRWKVMLGRKMGRMIESNYLEVRYEDLVLDSRTVLERVCRFIDAPFAVDMLAYHEGAAREMPKDSMRWHQSSVSAPRADKVRAWKRDMPLSDRIIFDSVAGDALEAFGYEREGHAKTFASRAKGAYYALVRRW